MSVIRDAQARDLPDLAEAMVRLQDAHVAALPSRYRQFEAGQAQDYLADLLTRRDAFLRVAENDETLAGHAVLVIEDRPESLFTKPERLGLVAQIEVAPDVRRTGIGSSLLKDCRTLAHERNASRVYLDVGSFNQAAYLFFVSSGFQPWSSKLSIAFS